MQIVSWGEIVPAACEHVAVAADTFPDAPRSLDSRRRFARVDRPIRPEAPPGSKLGGRALNDRQQTEALRRAGQDVVSSRSLRMP